MCQETHATEALTAGVVVSTNNASADPSVKPDVPLAPPVARRDDDRTVVCGVAPPGWNHKVPRQSENSPHKLLDPPVAVKDPWGWMRDDTRKDEHVLNHLHAENTYADAMTSHLQGLRQTLYNEMLASTDETDYCLPRPKGDYFIYSRTFEGKSYPICCRAPRNGASKDEELLSSCNGSEDEPIMPGEEIMLDVNELAEGKDYCSVGSLTISPSQKYLAYTVDFTGDEHYHLFFKNLKTGDIVDHDPALDMYGRVQWGKDDSTVFYMKKDETNRPHQVFRKVVDFNRKSTAMEDELIYDETDESFGTSIGKTLDDQYLVVYAASAETSEAWYVDLEADQGSSTASKLYCVAKRRPKVLYHVEHRNNMWWITSNIDKTPEMQLFTAPVKPHCDHYWSLLLDPETGKPCFDGYSRSLGGISCFADFVVAGGRQGGMPKVWVLTMDTVSHHKIRKFEAVSFPDAAHDVHISTHYEFNVDKLVVSYDSPVTPHEDLEIDLTDLSKRRVLKAKLVPDYNPDLYECDRIMVQSRDGTAKIPINLVYRKDVMKRHLETGQPVATHIYGYGAYGTCIEADFSPSLLPLLNRGVVHVTAQVRGGGELGRQWYEEPNGAKYLSKMNSFNDFVDVAKFLVHKKMTSPHLLSCEGHSAGGMLIGAVLNQAPELFKAAIMGVPFVDVICTMTDASIPLTIREWEEWGNPSEEKFFQYIMGYSPINNIKQGAKYPACLLSGGLHDRRVPYWEPAKYAAALRHAQSSTSGPILLKTDMCAGHFGTGDRYEHVWEAAFEYAFILDQLGLSD